MINVEITGLSEENIKKISENYISYIKKLNQNKKSSNKRFYIIIKNSKTHENIKTEEMIIEELNDNFYKIKECLARCGNVVKDISKKQEIILPDSPNKSGGHSLEHPPFLVIIVRLILLFVLRPF